MKSTNILVEVSDSVYDSVVVPYKKDKKFSKLIAALLSGYIEDDYIRSYIENALDGMQKASVDVLDDVLNNMQQSLANMGIYAEELKDTTNMGANYFKGKVEEQSKVDGAQSSTTEIKLEVEELKSQNAQILSMLSKLTNEGVSAVQKVEVKPQHKEFISKPVETEFEEVKQPVELKPIENEESTSDAIDASSILSSLMQGNTYSFKGGN